MSGMAKLEYVEINLEFSREGSTELETVSALCRSTQDQITEGLMERLQSANIVDGTLLLLVREMDGNELTFWVRNLFSFRPPRGYKDEAPKEETPKEAPK